MAILGNAPEDFVQQQIQDRQRFMASEKRDGTYHKFSTSRTAWVKLASGVSLEEGSKFGGGLRYPKKYVLFNGTSRKGQTLRKGIGPEQAYDTSDPDYGMVPMPGIDSVVVKPKNRGSIRIATVKMTCHSRRQFEILEELYLRLGYSMMLEWGWSHYLTSSKKWGLMGSTLINSQWFQEKTGRFYNYWLSEIFKLKKKYHGNYDAMFAKVSNFDWNFEKDGSYKITLKLISHGDIIESLTSLPPNKEYKSKMKGSPKEKGGSKSNPFYKYYQTGTGLYGGNSTAKLYNGWITKKAGTYVSWFQALKEGDSMFIDFTYNLDTTSIRDRLTEYFYSLAIQGFGCVSYSKPTIIYGSGGKATLQTSPFYITKIQFFGPTGVIYQYGEHTSEQYRDEFGTISHAEGDNKGGAPRRPQDIILTSRSIEGANDHYITKLGVKHNMQQGPGYEEYDPDADPFDMSRPTGKHHYINAFTTTPSTDGYQKTWKPGANALDPGKSDSSINRSTIDNRYQNFSPYSSKDRVTYIRFGHLLEAIKLLAIPSISEGNKQTPAINFDENQEIPMYCVQTPCNKSISYKPSNIVLNNDWFCIEDISKGIMTQNLSVIGGDLKAFIAKAIKNDPYFVTKSKEKEKVDERNKEIDDLNEITKRLPPGKF